MPGFHYLFRRCFLPIICALATSAPFATFASASYSLDTGDVLEIAVFGMQDFKRRVSINIDGDVSVPFLGEVRASGLSLAELRKTLAQRLTERGSIRNPQVTVELIEYRPFYISGDVSRPGALPYRPGLTVRHAIALAGGYDALRFRMENPLFVAPDLNSQHSSLWTELVKAQTRLASLKAEMAGVSELDLSNVERGPTPRQIVDQIIALERESLLVRLGDTDKERRFIEAGIERASGQIRSLEAALQQLSAAVGAQTAAIERASVNLNKGVTGVMRLDEERRGLASVKAQEVDTSARLALARKDRDDLRRTLERAEDDRRVRLIREIEDKTVEIEKVRSQIRAAGEKLLYAGAIKVQMRRGGGPEIVIHRRNDEGPQVLQASEDSDVLPGDVVDVLIRPEALTSPTSE